MVAESMDVEPLRTNSRMLLALVSTIDSIRMAAGILHGDHNRFLVHVIAIN
jgi:hypothetical protein